MICRTAPAKLIAVKNSILLTKYFVESVDFIKFLSEYSTAFFRHNINQGLPFWPKSWFRRKNTFCSQSSLHHFLSISQFLDFSNLILNSYFEVTFVTCQDGWVVRALDCHARDPWFKSHWQQAFLLRKGFQKFFKKWLSPMWKWWDISSSSIMAISSLFLVRGGTF